MSRIIGRAIWLISMGYSSSAMFGAIFQQRPFDAGVMLTIFVVATMMFYFNLSGEEAQDE